MTNSSALSRRGFSTFLAAAPAALAQQAPDPNTSSQLQRKVTRPADTPPFGASLEYRHAPAAPRVEPFPMRQVRVTGGIFRQVQEWNRGYMSRLHPDRLLLNFRTNAGLPTSSAQPLGGWEAPADGKFETELRGHFTGHFLSASALLWASTGDEKARANADYMVEELSKVQARLAGGFLSAFPTELFERLDTVSLDPQTGRPRPGGPKLPWAPFYTIHKILAGLIDMHRLAGSRRALELALRLAEWTDTYTGSKSEAHMQEILAVEFGGMADSLYDLAAITSDARWARVADRFHKKRFLNPLGLRRDELRFLHVNTHIPQILAAANRYNLSSDPRFRDVTSFFFDEVTSARSYVTTGTSNGEEWQSEPRRLAAELFHGHTTATAECCCSYNMLKLARQLFAWTAEPRYFDFYERALLNHRLGTILPEKGYTQYYLSHAPGAWKTFNDEDRSFWCCTGTGVEEYAKLNDSIYWRDAAGLYVNLFIDSELNWEEKGLRLKQTTRFPDEPATSFTLTLRQPLRFALRLRIPAWLASAPVIKLNGRELETSAEPGSYFTLQREWKTGDKLELALPMRLSVEAMPDDPGLQAFLYGPLVLAGDLGDEGLDPRRVVGPSGPWFAPPGMPAPSGDEAPAAGLPPLPKLEMPALKASGGADSLLASTGAPLTFQTRTAARPFTLRPLNTIFNRRYNIYWRVS